MGEILAIMAGNFFALATMLSQRGMREASAQAAVTISLLFNNLIYGIFLLAVLHYVEIPPLTLKGFLYAVAGGLMGNIIARTLMFSSVRRIGSARTVSLSLTQTLFTIIFGTLILKETLNLQAWIGVVLVIWGVYWLSLEQINYEKSKKLFSETLPSMQIDHKRTLIQHSTQNIPLYHNSLSSARDKIQGIAFALLCGLAYSGADLSRKLSLIQIPFPLMSSAIGGFAALFIQTLIFSFRDGWREIKQLSRFSLIQLTISGIIGGLAIICLYSALNLAPVILVNSLYNIKAAIPIILGPLLLGSEERITKSLVGHTTIILIGILLLILK